MANPEMRCELLEMEGVLNVRDIGGYPAKNGKHIKKRRFIRAGSMYHMTSRGLSQLKDHGVQCVVDLRSGSEVKRYPDPLGGSGIVSAHVPMLDYVQSNMSENDYSSYPESLSQMYCDLLDSGKQQFLSVFRIFAHPDHRTILYHCTAGKDRTGVTTMLLLNLAGVADEVIAEDYSWSKQLIGPVSIPAGIDNFPEYVFDSNPESMLYAIEYLKKNYGDAESYLKICGLSEKDINSVEWKLLEN